MKAAKVIAKVLVALAAVAGAVYVVATYGSQIVAWCKKVLASLPSCKAEISCTIETDAETAEEEAVEEEAVEEASAEEAAAEEVVEAAEEAPAAEETVVAEDADFEA